MFIKSVYRLVLTGVLLITLNTALKAQETAPEEKKNLIRALMAVTNAQAKVEAMLEAMLDQVGKDMLQMLKQRADDDETLTREEREKLLQTSGETSERIVRRFREAFGQRINRQVLEEIEYDSYDKYFTLNELKDLIAFYKTPTGQKTINIMPQLLADSMAKLDERLGPQVQKIIEEIIEEEVKKFEKLVPHKAPQEEPPCAQIAI